MGAPKIGLDMCYVAPLTESSDVADGTPTWGTAVALPGAVMADLTPNGNLNTDWGDNRAFFVMNSRGNLQVNLEFIDITGEIKAALLGQTRSNGITAEQTLDQSPYYALMFRIWIGGTYGGAEIYHYFSLPKGKFSVPDTKAETKKENISFNHVTLNAEFVPLIANGNLCLNGRTDESLSAAAASAWFDSPVYQVTQDLGALSCVITGLAGNTIFTFAKVGGGTFNMAEASVVVGSSLIVAGAGGASLPGAIVWTGEGTASVVGTFTPTSAYGAETVVCTVTDSVKDENGVTCTPITTSLTYPI